MERKDRKKKKWKSQRRGECSGYRTEILRQRKGYIEGFGKSGRRGGGRKRKVGKRKKRGSRQML